MNFRDRIFVQGFSVFIAKHHLFKALRLFCIYRNILQMHTVLRIMCVRKNSSTSPYSSVCWIIFIIVFEGAAFIKSIKSPISSVH